MMRKAKNGGRKNFTAPSQGGKKRFIIINGYI
jgi:hypothetical protein